MKSIFDTLFRGSVLMAPKYILFPILFGWVAGFGAHYGWPYHVSLPVALTGLAIGIVAVVYSAKQEAKEAEARNQK